MPISFEVYKISSKGETQDEVVVSSFEERETPTEDGGGTSWKKRKHLAR